MINFQEISAGSSFGQVNAAHLGFKNLTEETVAQFKDDIERDTFAWLKKNPLPKRYDNLWDWICRRPASDSPAWVSVPFEGSTIDLGTWEDILKDAERQCRRIGATRSVEFSIEFFSTSLIKIAPVVFMGFVVVQDTNNPKEFYRIGIVEGQY